jgi:hypothetical protein
MNTKKSYQRSIIYAIKTDTGYTDLQTQDGTIAKRAATKHGKRELYIRLCQSRYYVRSAVKTGNKWGRV